MSAPERPSGAPADGILLSGQPKGPSATQPTGMLPGRYVRRFGLGTRLLHWGLAIPFLLLLVTGLTNFWPEAKALHVGGSRVFAWLHVVLGFLFLAEVPLLVGLLLGRPVRRDIADLGRADAADLRWLDHAVAVALGSPSQPPPVGKFNGGQKLNAMIVLVATAALLGTGAVLGINYVSKSVFDVFFVADVFRWHSLLAFMVIPVVVGHLYLALVHPSTRAALRGITRGEVRRDWAQRHHPAWYAEITALSDAAESGSDADGRSAAHRDRRDGPEH